MPIYIIIIVVCILALTAWVILHPSPLFEDNWYLHAWGGPRIGEFTQNLQRVTFALGETQESIMLVPLQNNIQPMEFALDEISFTCVKAHTEEGGLRFTLEYTNDPGYDIADLKVYNQNDVIAELTFLKEEN